MVDGTTVAYGVGALIAAEATGITNFSGGGGSGPVIVAPGSDGGGGSGAMPIPVPSGDTGGSGSGATEALAALAGRVGDTSSNVTDVANTQTGLAAEIGELRAKLEILQDTQKSTEDIRDIIDGSRDKFDIPSPGGDDDSPGDTGPSLSETQKIAMEQGRDPFGLQATQGGVVGGIAEGLRAAGDTATDVVDSVGNPGRNPEDGTFFGFIGDAGRTTGEAYREATGWKREERESIADKFDNASDWSNKAADTINPFKKGFI